MSDTLTNALRGGSVLDRLANPTVVNPLAAYSNAAEAAGQVWRIRQAQAQQAAGQAAIGAIDEQGRFDPAKFNQNLAAAGPDAALAAQEAVKNAQALQGAQIEQGSKMQAALSAAIAPVLKLPDEHLHDGVALAAQGLIATGAVPADVALRYLSRMPNDPGAMRTTLEQLRVGAMSPEQQQDNIYGEPHLYTAPGGVNKTLVVAPPSAGYGVGVPPQPGAVGGLTAREGAEPVQTGVTPQGAPIKAPLRSSPFAPAGEGGQIGSGRYPNAALRNPAASGSQPAPPPGGGVVTDLPPGQKTALETAGTQSAANFQRINDQGVTAQSQNAILSNMLADARNFTTGPLARQILWSRQIRQRFGLPVDEKATSAGEDFNKMAATLANAQGATSDARLNVTLDATPHAELSPGGVDLIIRQLQGNNDYLQARKVLAATYPDKADVTGFENTLGRNLDPRAFQLARLQPGKQRSDFLASITDPAEQKKLMTAYAWAQNRGLLGGQ